jgi:hypothetical protein
VKFIPKKSSHIIKINVEELGPSKKILIGAQFNLAEKSPFKDHVKLRTHKSAINSMESIGMKISQKDIPLLDPVYGKLSENEEKSNSNRNLNLFYRVEERLKPKSFKKQLKTKAKNTSFYSKDGVFSPLKPKTQDMSASSVYTSIAKNKKKSKFLPYQ